MGPGRSPTIRLLPTIRLVAAKELRSSLRDSQTLLYTLALPLLLYPVLFWVMIQVSSLLESRRQVREVAVAVAFEGEPVANRAADLGARLERAAAAPEDGSEPAAGRLSVESMVGPRSQAETNALVLVPDGEKRAAFDLVLWLPNEGEWLAVHNSAQPNSALALQRVEALLADEAQRARREAVEEGETLAPLSVERRDLASGREQGAYLISVMVPMLIVLMGVFGAFYPAVDLTAGERERKCEETTLLLPVPRAGLWLGKLAAVAVLSLLATALNLFGIVFAANHLLAMVGAGAIEVTLGVRELLLTLPFALVLVVLTSAVLTGLASLTQTFKQGQSLLGGAQMLFMAPALASTLPGLELTAGTAPTPIVGLALALRSVLRGGDLEVGLLALTLVSHAVYALVAAWIAVRLLAGELHTASDPSALDRLRAAFLPPRRP